MTYMFLSFQLPRFLPKTYRLQNHHCRRRCGRDRQLSGDPRVIRLRREETEEHGRCGTGGCFFLCEWFETNGARLLQPWLPTPRRRSTLVRPFSHPLRFSHRFLRREFCAGGCFLSIDMFREVGIGGSINVTDAV